MSYERTQHIHTHMWTTEWMNHSFCVITIFECMIKISLLFLFLFLVSWTHTCITQSINGNNCLFGALCVQHRIFVVCTWYFNEWLNFFFWLIGICYFLIQLLTWLMHFWISLAMSLRQFDCLFLTKSWLCVANRIYLTLDQRSKQTECVAIVRIGLNRNSVSIRNTHAIGKLFFVVHDTFNLFQFNRPGNSMRKKSVHL